MSEANSALPIGESAKPYKDLRSVAPAKDDSLRAARKVNANSSLQRTKSLGSSKNYQHASAGSKMSPLALNIVATPDSTPGTTPLVTDGHPVSHYAPLLTESVVARSAISVSDEFPLSKDDVGPQKFKKLKLLGKGAVGKVYLVRLEQSNQLFAMKVLTKEEMVKRNRVKRVMTEREILATVNHPFIVTMYASFQTASRLCFVMEFCEAGEFFRVLSKQPKKRLPEDAARFYAAEVILALEYLHHMGFVYRDLKPENILMRKSGHIALTDFDLSTQGQAVSPRVVVKHMSFVDRMKELAMKRSDSGSKLHIMDIIDSEPVMITQSTSFVGTEEYIAPEVLKGSGQTAAVDWWTLGILIFEMLTGTTPFKGKNTQQTYANIAKSDISWPLDLDISNEAKAIVKKLLRREAEKRLGAESGATEIKRDKWFTGMNFSLIRNETPPILPRMRDPYDMSQYEGLLDASDESFDDNEPISHTYTPLLEATNSNAVRMNTGGIANELRQESATKGGHNVAFVEVEERAMLETRQPINIDELVASVDLTEQAASGDPASGSIVHTPSKLLVSSQQLDDANVASFGSGLNLSRREKSTKSAVPSDLFRGFDSTKSTDEISRKY